MGELGSGRMGRRIHLPGVLVFLWPQQTDSTALNTSQLSWQNPESKSMSCSFHPGLPGFHQCKSKTSHWLLCWTKWVHFYIVSAQQSCLTWSEEHCQDADVNREKNLLNLPLLCSGGSSTQTTWMVWLQLNSSFFKISWFPKHLFFFSLPSGHAHSLQQNEVSLLVWENKMPFPGFHMPGVLTLVASPFQAIQLLLTIICLSLASLNEILPNTISCCQTGRKLLAWGEKIIFSVEEDSKIMFYVKLKHPSWFLAHHKSDFLLLILLLESKTLIVSNYHFLTLKPTKLYSLSGISV